jgi:hypothetical protein
MNIYNLSRFLRIDDSINKVLSDYSILTKTFNRKKGIKFYDYTNKYEIKDSLEKESNT